MPKQKTDFIHFNKDFYSSSHNRKEIAKKVDNLLAESEAKNKLIAAVIPFSSTKNPIEWLSESSKISLIQKGDVSQFKQDFYSREEVKIEEGRFFIYEHPKYKQIYIALTLEERGFQNKWIAFFRRLPPRIMTTFIKQQRLKELLEQFQENNAFDKLIVKRASSKNRIEQDGEEKDISTVDWLGMPIAEAFELAYQRNGWFKSLQFEAIKNLRRYATISLSRDGVIKTNNLFSQVFESFITPICKIIYDNIRLFGNRSRRDNETLSPRPLVIDFEREQFAEVSENAKFIQAMRQFETASVSVLHGNPYIHLSVVDYFDGSAFDIWVLSSDKLIIVPQMKGSVPAIKRIINHIFDTYAEGRIRDYEEISR
ncbi:MAG: hypothetical protein Kow0090_01910 [Myxococcota bacterium]